MFHFCAVSMDLAEFLSKSCMDLIRFQYVAVGMLGIETAYTVNCKAHVFG